jgi:hypothetical protein
LSEIETEETWTWKGLGGNEGDFSDREDHVCTERLSSSLSPAAQPHTLEVNGSCHKDYAFTRVLQKVCQSAPRAIIQILITGTQIFGKALYAAGTQAVKSILFPT